MYPLQKPEQKLYDAVDGNNVKVITALLDFGVDVNAKVCVTFFKIRKYSH